jgi:adenylate cyclase
VRFFLDGSVRCQDEKILVGVRLTDTTTGAHVWAETYKAKAMAALGGMYADAFLIYSGSKDYLERALALVEKAYRLNPNDYMVQFIRAYVYFYTRGEDTFMAALELAVRTNPNISTNGELALYCAYAGHSDRAVALFERARYLNPHIPGYYHLTPFTAHAYRGDYEQPLSETQQIRIPALFMDPIARAVALGYLGRNEEAGAVVAELLQLVPDFGESGQELIKRIWRYEQPVELLIEGLRKARMEF